MAKAARVPRRKVPRKKAKAGKAPSFPLRCAAIDVGSSAIRFVAAEFVAPGRFQVLASERVPVRMGHGVFLSGRLTPQSLDAGVKAIASFAAQMRRLSITHCRAIATSAVREADNGASFRDRVRRETGVELEAITGAEEARLFYLAVRHRVPLGPEGMLLVDLGGGSVEVALVDDSGIRWIESHTMGSVRLLEELAVAGEEPGRFARLVSEYVATLRLPAFPPGRRPAGFIATGGNIEALARLAGATPRVDGVAELETAALVRTIATLSRLSFRQRVERLGLKEDRADLILPAALLYRRLAQLAGAERILVPFVGVKEGVLLDLVDDLTAHVAHEDRARETTWHGAVALGRRYAFDEAHAVQVARLSASLFDQLAPLHGYGPAERRMLEAAALLHDIGAFVSNKRHHKHTLYLVGSSELPGFAPREIDVVANVARYHRKGDPAPRHAEFMRLAPADRRRVVRLAALVRIADALDREHRQRVSGVTVKVRRARARLSVAGGGDLLLESWALQKKAQLFRRAYRLALEWRADPVAP